MRGKTEHKRVQAGLMDYEDRVVMQEQGLQPLSPDRVSDLHEMAAIGNLKAVLHYCQSGVDVNGQNAMNGW